jgi:hypothetical protein
MKPRPQLIWHTLHTGCNLILRLFLSSASSVFVFFFLYYARFTPHSQLERQTRYTPIPILLRISCLCSCIYALALPYYTPVSCLSSISYLLRTLSPLSSSSDQIYNWLGLFLDIGNISSLDLFFFLFQRWSECGVLSCLFEELKDASICSFSGSILFLE